jgi:hypothetical protein
MHGRLSAYWPTLANPAAKTYRLQRLNGLNEQRDEYP